MCIRDRYHLDGGDHDAVRQGGLGGFPRQASPPKRLNHYPGVLPQFFLSSPSEVDSPFFKPVLAIRGSSGSPGSSSERNPWMAESTRETIRRKIMKKNFFLYRGRTEEPQGGAEERKNSRSLELAWRRAEEELRKNPEQMYALGWGAESPGLGGTSTLWTSRPPNLLDRACRHEFR